MTDDTGAWTPGTLGPDAISAEKALHALVYSQGSPALAAERLGLQSADTLLAVIVTDETAHEKMRQIMRGFTMLKLLGVAATLEDTLFERLDELDARDVAKLFTSVLQLADLMTRANQTVTPANPADAREQLLRSLPAPIQRAFRVVQGTSMDEIMANAGSAGEGAA